MQVKDLIKELETIKDKEREITVLLGDDDSDDQEWSDFELHHTDDLEQVVEIFIHYDQRDK